MHTFEGENGTIIIYNSDLSGLVKIKTSDAEIEVDGDDLMVFMNNWAINQQIAMLESQLR
jgi:hypothetical protein